MFFAVITVMNNRLCLLRTWQYSVPRANTYHCNSNSPVQSSLKLGKYDFFCKLKLLQDICWLSTFYSALAYINSPFSCRSKLFTSILTFSVSLNHLLLSLNPKSITLVVNKPLTFVFLQLFMKRFILTETLKTFHNLNFSKGLSRLLFFSMVVITKSDAILVSCCDSDVGPLSCSGHS